MLPAPIRAEPSTPAVTQNKDLSIYDASGTRVLRRTTTSSGTTMTAYAFGLEEHSYFNSGGHKGDLYYYTLGGRLLGALDNTGKTTFYLTDALGSVLASFSSAAGIAAIKGNQVFGPYGNARDFQGTINTAKGFTGQYNDSLTGLDYYGSRYYDQVAGVFLSADVKQGNMQGMNPYAYVGGNPETKNDPTGQMFINPGGGGGGTTTIPCSCAQGPQPVPPPVALGGGYLPNDPGWHQVGSLIAFGFQYGQQIVTSSVLEAFFRNQFDWYDSGVQVTLNRLIAYYLALTSQQFRDDFKGTVKDSNNVGAGFYYVTDAQGNLVNSNTAAQYPAIGTNRLPNGQSHSEQLLVDDLRDNIIPGLQLQAGDTLHYVLYTQLSPCSYACQPKLASSQWANEIKKAVGSGVNVDFSIWTSKVHGDPRKTPVLNVSQVRSFYLYSYDAGYNVSAEWLSP